MTRYLITVFTLLSASTGLAQEILVQPYLQDMNPTTVTVMWESSYGAESLVEWGLSPALGNRSQGEAALGTGASRVHSVELADLNPDTAYYYRVQSDAAVSGVYRFRTPRPTEDEAPFRLVAISDMQRDWSRPNIFGQVVQDGIIGWFSERFGGELSDELALVMIAGDLVDNGLSVDEWRSTFFEPGAELFSQVPVYPVPGNHERDSHYFFNYFHLPENGSFGLEEHWWWIDRSNLRLIGLDSNQGYRTQQQLDWLEDLLAQTCQDPWVDFVFAQLHHPHRSELWIAGNTDFTGEVIQRLEQFSSQCSKPSAHFFGHTHGYSRGQSRDHNHSMINVATAGGRIDDWGEYAQQDYAEYVMSTADYGFVVAELAAGDEPSFTLRRLSRGNPDQPRNNEETDLITIRRYNQGPQQPHGRAHQESVRPDCLTLRASPFHDPEDDPHGASHWQVSYHCDDFEAPLIDRWLQHKNLYFNEDRQAEDDLEDEILRGLEPETNYCWRVRYRDQGLAWSPWSESLPFRTTISPGGANLLINGDAEAGTTGWTTVRGYLESITDGECDGIEPHSGSRYFAVGGVCEAEAEAEAHQDVDVSDLAEAIDAGERHAQLSAWLSDFNGSDQIDVDLIFLDHDGSQLGNSEPLSRRARGWQRQERVTPIPVGSRFIRVRLRGTRHAGNDNDAYVDDLILRVLREDELGCAPAPEAQPPPGQADAGPNTATDSGPRPRADGGRVPGPGDPTDTGCGCSNQPLNSAAVLLLGALLFRRRRMGLGSRVSNRRHSDV